MMKRLIKKWLRRQVAEDVSFNSGLGNGGYVLYGLVKAMRPSICVEIGSARGLSACLIGKALKENGHGRLYAIDPHVATAWNDDGARDSLKDMEDNLRYFGVSKYVDIIRRFSSEAAREWQEPIDLLFIDGDHSYEGVKRDWNDFVRFVKRFGVVVFHDTTWELHRDSQWYRNDMGVPKFVEELRRTGVPIVTVDEFCGISIAQPGIGGVQLVP